MEENAVDLFDYLRVIWKRKILIIVVSSVCIGVGVGVGVMNSRLKPKLPVTYRAAAVVKIGKKVKLAPTSGIQTTVTYIESPAYLIKTFALDYDIKINEVPGYHLDVEQVGALAMLKLILKGPDRGVERVLKELVDMLIDEHRRKAKISVVAYKDFMNRLEADAEMLKKEILVIEAGIREMKGKEGEYLMHIDSITKKGGASGDRSAFLNMLYLKTIDKERELSGNRASLREIQRQLIMQQITLGNLEEYKTELVGKIRSSAIEPKKKKQRSTIALAVVAGLIMSLFIAFFMEYIEESKSKRKGKLQG